jgi:TonB family protein
MRFWQYISVITLIYVIAFSGSQSGTIETTRVGGNKDSTGESAPLIVPPELVYQAIPDYPCRAKETGDTGTVLLRICVGVEGVVVDVTVAKPSGVKLLERAALNAAYKNKFKPATLDGQPIEFWLQCPVTFFHSDGGTPSADQSGEISVDSNAYQAAFGEFTPIETGADGSAPNPDEFIPLEIKPEMIHQNPPDYPRDAKKAGITGTVWVKELVDEEGNVIKAIVSKSSGSISLDDAALKAAFKNKFKPGIQKGRPVKVWVTYPVEFKLDKK